MEAIEGLHAYPLYHVTRGDALEKVGNYSEAVAAFTRAAELEPNDALKAIFRSRATMATSTSTAQADEAN